MKTFLLRWAVIIIAVYLVAWGLPQTGLFGGEVVGALGSHLAFSGVAIVVFASDFDGKDRRALDELHTYALRRGVCVEGNIGAEHFTSCKVYDEARTI